MAFIEDYNDMLIEHVIVGLTRNHRSKEFLAFVGMTFLYKAMQKFIDLVEEAEWKNLNDIKSDL